MHRTPKDILLITNYYHFEEEKGSSRYRSLAEMIACNKNWSLEIITSDFYHQTKKYRNDGVETSHLPFRVTFCHEEGYSKNIGFQRLRSCRSFGKNVLTYLEKREKPDVIYQVVPSLDVADLVSLYAQKNHIPLIIDVQDLWPEAFRMAVDLPIISDIMFEPMKQKANRIYSRADRIIAVSDTYVQRALSVNGKCEGGLGVYIGTDNSYAMSLMCQHEVCKPENEFWISYVGALGHSYDIDTVSQAIAILNKRGIKNIVFHVMGDGPLKEQFFSFAKKLKINAQFHGFVEYGEMLAILSASDIAVNPIVGKSAASVINKVSDYALAGVPVINTQKSKEYRDLLESYQCGINCECENAESVADAIVSLYGNSDLCKQMKKNAQRLNKERFSRQDTYLKIIDLIADILE